MADRQTVSIPVGIPWELARTEVRETWSGYRLDDLDRWWVVASGQPLEWDGNEPNEVFHQYGYLYELDFAPEGEGPPGPLWGEFFWDMLCYRSQAEAEVIAKLVDGHAVNVGDVTRLDHWMIGIPRAVLPKRKSAQFLVEDAKRRYGR